MASGASPASSFSWTRLDRLVHLQFAHGLGEWGGCHPTSLVSVIPGRNDENNYNLKYGQEYYQL